MSQNLPTASILGTALPRRRLLVLGGLGLTGLATSSLLGAPSADAHGTLIRRSEIADVITRYEVGGAPTPFSYDPAFYGRLEQFMKFWRINSPAWVPTGIQTSGVHADHRPSAAHNAGRGFDLTRMYATVNGKPAKVFNGRFDQWSTADLEGRTETARQYWATSACAHYHFRNVLTYAYNSDHRNHMHIDNLESGRYDSKFDRGSRAQVVHVQACCHHIFGISTKIDGVWGSSTEQNSRRVLAGAGVAGGLTTSQANWLTFNRLSFRAGSRPRP